MPKSCGWELPGSCSSSVFLETLISALLSEVKFSKSWNLIWLSACTLDNLFDNLSNLKFISSNLLVSSWNWFSISESLSKCLVKTSSELNSEVAELSELLFKELFVCE